MYKLFGFAIIDYESSQYFETLFDKLIQSRKSDEAGNDFLQSLANKIAIVDPNDQDTTTDPNTRIVWSKKGKHVAITTSTLYHFWTTSLDGDFTSR